MPVSAPTIPKPCTGSVRRARFTRHTSRVDQSAGGSSADSSLEACAPTLSLALLGVQEVAKCQTTDAHLSLGDVCRSYRRLKDQCREEYLMYNLPAAALSQARQDLSCILNGRHGERSIQLCNLKFLRCIGL